MPQSVLNKLTLFSMILITAFFILPGNLLAQNQIKSMKKNKQLIQKGFDQWTNGSASFFDLLADDVTWTITGNSPIAKTYNSRQQFLDEAITPINERLSERIVPTLRALYAEGDMVIALWDGKGMAKDGISYNNTYSWYMKVKGEKIVEVIAFFDSIELADLWKRLPAAK
jgi:uncharacterized protein